MFEKKIKKDVTDISFLVTDGCAWEMNKQGGKAAPHAIEVVDLETGQLRFIKSGSIIKFVDGEITNSHNQEDYNKQK